MRTEQGHASIEFTMTLPFLLLIFLLVYNSAVLMLIKQEDAVSVRRAAWSAALYRDKGAAVAQLACRRIDLDRSFGADFSVSCRNPQADGNPFLRDMERAGGRSLRGVTRVIQRDTAPFVTVGRSSSRFQAAGGWAGEKLGDVSWRNRHAVSANRSWELGDLPAGYNRFLRKELKQSRKLFPNIFRRQR